MLDEPAGLRPRFARDCSILAGRVPLPGCSAVSLFGPHWVLDSDPAPQVPQAGRRLARPIRASYPVSKRRRPDFLVVDRCSVTPAKLMLRSS
jgi:hypothetical protein